MSKTTKWAQPGVIFYLQPHGARKIWRYRYRYLDGFNRVRHIHRSSKTADLKVAKQRAWQNFLARTGKAAPTVFDNKVPDCQALIACYEENISQEDGARTSPATVKTNVNAFARFIRLAFDREPVAVSTAELSPEAVKRWRAARYQLAGLVFGQDEDLRLNYSLNSSWQHIKGIFSKAALRLYERELGFTLDLSAFLRVSRLQQFDTRYQPIAPGTVAAMDRDSLELDPDERIIYELARFYGLTKREIRTVRWHWIEDDGASQVLAIRYREAIPALGIPAWKSKQNTKYGRLAINPARLASWRQLAPCLESHGYIVPRVNKTAIDNAIRHLNAWLGEYLPDRQKKLHELRKHAGSEVLMRAGLVEAAAFLRDSIKTTERHYASFLRPATSADPYELPEVKEKSA